MKSGALVRQIYKRIHPDRSSERNTEPLQALLSAFESCVTSSATISRSFREPQTMALEVEVRDVEQPIHLQLPASASAFSMSRFVVNELCPKLGITIDDAESLTVYDVLLGLGVIDAQDELVADGLLPPEWKRLVLGNPEKIVQFGSSMYDAKYGVGVSLSEFLRKHVGTALLNSMASQVIVPRSSYVESIDPASSSHCKLTIPELQRIWQLDCARSRVHGIRCLFDSEMYQLYKHALVYRRLYAVWQRTERVAQALWSVVQVPGNSDENGITKYISSKDKKHFGSFVSIDAFGRIAVPLTAFVPHALAVDDVSPFQWIAKAEESALFEPVEQEIFEFVSSNQMKVVIERKKDHAETDARIQHLVQELLCSLDVYTLFCDHSCSSSENSVSALSKLLKYCRSSGRSNNFTSTNLKYATICFVAGDDQSRLDSFVSTDDCESGETGVHVGKEAGAIYVNVDKIADPIATFASINRVAALARSISSRNTSEMNELQELELRAKRLLRLRSLRRHSKKKVSVKHMKHACRRIISMNQRSKRMLQGMHIRIDGANAPCQFEVLSSVVRIPWNFAE